MKVDRHHLPTLIAKFTHIRNVMREVAQDPKNDLYMESWVKPGHTCGTAACVLGYVAIADGRKAQNNTTLASYAANLADHLDECCICVFGNTHLSQSVWSALAYPRTDAAKDSELFTEEEIDSFKHLTHKTQPKDAADYLDAVIERLEAIK